MLDEDLKPWLIEVNGSPSFSTDTPLDKSIKERVIGDALRILHLSPEDKVIYRRKLKFGPTIKNMTAKMVRECRQEREAELKLAQKLADEWEETNSGGYQRIFPIKVYILPGEGYNIDLKDSSAADAEKYNIFMRVAKEAWMSIEARMEFVII